MINLLLADDDFDDAFFFEEAMKDLADKVNVITVKDGEQLMAYLKRAPGELPTLLFLDLNMPGKNGFDCLKEIKSNDRLKSLPVIIYSTSDQKEVITLLYNAGAQFYIQKPDNFSKLKKVVKKAIELGTKTNFVQPRLECFVLTA